MSQGVLSEHPPVMTYQDRQAPYYVHLLDDVKQSSAVPTLHIRLLGDFLLRVNESPVSNLDDLPRLQSLLAYLVLHRAAPQFRSSLAYLLWPDSTDGQAHTNLRNLLYKLRVTLPEIDTFLCIERHSISWRQGAPLSLDVVDFERAMAQAEQARFMQDPSTEREALEEAVRLYQGDLLPSCYEDWTQAERDRLQHLFREALERLIELLEQDHNELGAIRIAQRMLRYDQLHEATYRHLMHLHAARGDRAAVLRTYQNCAAILQRELSVQPTLTTRKLYERLMRSED